MSKRERSFAEVVRLFQRMCRALSAGEAESACKGCPVGRMAPGECPWALAEDEISEKWLEGFESAVAKWNEENPGPGYPTWQEWQRQVFPGASVDIMPCAFMTTEDTRGCEFRCEDCIQKPVPEAYAKKLHIAPREEKK